PPNVKPSSHCWTTSWSSAVVRAGSGAAVALSSDRLRPRRRAPVFRERSHLWRPQPRTLSCAPPLTANAELRGPVDSERRVARPNRQIGRRGQRSAPGEPQKLAFGAGGAGGAVARGQWDAEVSARGRGEGEGTSRCWPADAGRTMLAGSRGHRLAHPPQARPVGTPTPAHAGRARGQRRRARRVNQLSGVKSRLAMYSGRGAGAANGSVSVFS